MEGGDADHPPAQDQRHDQQDRVAQPQRQRFAGRSGRRRAFRGHQIPRSSTASYTRWIATMNAAWRIFTLRFFAISATSA